MKVINLKDYGVVVFQSSLTVEAFKALQKHMPSALKLQDEERNDIFALAYKEGKGSISEYGICFDKADSEGNVLITVQATLSSAEIADEYAAIILKAKAIEEYALGAYASLQQELLSIAEDIVDGTPATVACECNCQAPDSEESEDK